MPCDSCTHLCIRHEIHLLSQLRKTIGTILKNIEDSTLAEVPDINTATGKHSPISEISMDGPFDDWVNHQFQCASCGELFSLSVETYHGSGGAWKPVNPASILENG